MVYIRGQREDYDNWAAQGNEGWSYEEVLPYFKRSEHRAEGANDYHGQGGPLWVENPPLEEKLELADIFVEAAVQTGLPFNEDFNGASQEGAGDYQTNIRAGKRQSAARTFLKACEHRPNLQIVTGALAQKILLEDGRAVGIRYQTSGKHAATVEARASGEIILCGGVINSPQLLELSGIGNPEHLEKAGIEVTHALPGVGENLQDHLTVNIQQGINGLKTFYEETKPLAILGNAIKYFTRGKGLLAHPAAQIGVFFRSSDDEPTPNAQIHFAPAASEPDAKGNLKTTQGTTATVCNLRPESRGSVHVRSKDPSQYPVIRANYLDTEKDRQVMIDAFRRVREIFRAPALANHLGTEFRPGPQVESDEEILAYVRAEAESVYHPVGTCKMGQGDDAVVDERLRVRGIQGLRVADASIMPNIVSGNTHAPAVMIAEKCADMLLQDAGVRVTLPEGMTDAEEAGNRAPAPLKAVAN
ncbi:GMC family oxidoreductase [Halioglobus japonicus]|nr:GMC oxidoreductase [Halioglobus japonicus]